MSMEFQEQLNRTLINASNAGYFDIVKLLLNNGANNITNGCWLAIYGVTKHLEMGLHNPNKMIIRMYANTIKLLLTDEISENDLLERIEILLPLKRSEEVIKVLQNEVNRRIFKKVIRIQVIRDIQSIIYQFLRS